MQPETTEIENIQRKSDGSYVVSFRGYPFHVTVAETPDVYALVLAQIEDGAPVSDYVDPSSGEVSPEEVARRELIWVASELHNAGLEICKHEDADPLSHGTEQAWRTYRRELRAWANNSLFPNVENRPFSPEPN
jgi:hypothetical protein